MPKPTVKLERVKTPDFSMKHQFIRPAVGLFTNEGVEHYYFQLWLPTEVSNPNSMTVEYVEVHPWMIVDTGELIEWESERLLERGLVAESGLAKFPLRWDLADLKRYCEKPEAPNPIEVYNKIIGEMKKYIEFRDEGHYTIIALWIIGSYLHPIFETYPFLYVGGTKGVGKTKTLRFIEMLAFNSVNSLSVSSASLYRICQGMAATLLIDETSYLSSRERHEDLRTLLYGRYKSGQTVQRVEKKGKIGKLEVEYFRVYGPTAMANIEGLEDVLADRAIEIIMLRTTNSEIANREILEDKPVWQEIRNMLYRLALQHWSVVRKIYRELNGENIKVKLQLTGRQMERWKPLIAIALWIGGEITNILANAILKLEKEKSEESIETLDYILLTALSRNVKEDAYYSLKDIKNWIQTELGEDQPPKWLDGRVIGRYLRKFGFTEKRRVGGGVEYLLKVKNIIEVCKRMGVESVDNSSLSSVSSLINSRLTSEQSEKSEQKCKKNIYIICRNCLQTLNNIKTYQNTGQLGKCELCGRYDQMFKAEIVLEE